LCRARRRLAGCVDLLDEALGGEVVQQLLEAVQTQHGAKRFEGAFAVDEDQDATQFGRQTEGAAFDFREAFFGFGVGKHLSSPLVCSFFRRPNSAAR
jgi:hypothetical protein